VGPVSAMMRRAVPFRRRIPLPWRGLRFLPLVAVVAGCLKTETHVEYPGDLYHPDYVKRSKAVAEFARRQDKTQLPEAFRLLLDDDANIRLVAYETIRDLSPGAEDKGYRPYLPRDVRFGIVVRWQTWWVKTEGKGEAAGDGQPEPAATGAGEGAEDFGTAEAAHG